MIKIFKGNIVTSYSIGELTVFENSYLVAENGKVLAIYKKLPTKYSKLLVKNYGDCLIFQAFSDMHLHAPQFANVGRGLDLQLLEWLNKYTFPEEANFKYTSYATRVYRKLAKELVKNGTTRVCMFGSIHYKNTLILMNELKKVGIVGYVGKVSEDQNCSFLDEDTTKSIKDNKEFIKLASKFRTIKPIITPRFAPACTNKLMGALGKLAKECDLPIQSHLSENIDEIKWVQKLHSECSEYYQTYQKFGLWNNKTLMAHCVHSSKDELQAIKDAGVYVVHCASSNENILSGFAPIRKMLNMGIKVVLGSDISGGDSISMFDNVVSTIKASKARCIMDKYKTPFLTVAEAYYLATSASNDFFDEKPGIANGNTLNIIVLDDKKLINTNKMTVEERFERAMYLRQPNAIKAIYYNQRKIF